MKTVLCYGDSNTFGWNPISFDPLDTQVVLGQHRFDENKRWTGIMSNELGNGYLPYRSGE